MNMNSNAATVFGAIDLDNGTMRTCDGQLIEHDPTGYGPCAACGMTAPFRLAPSNTMLCAADMIEMSMEIKKRQQLQIEDEIALKRLDDPFWGT